MPLEMVFWEPQNWRPLKPPLLKPYCRLHGQINSPESQICNSVGPCSKHRNYILREFIRIGGRSAKEHVIFLEMNSPTHFSVYVIWIQEGFTAEPLRMIRGEIFSGMIRIQARQSEIQAESRSYRPKVGDTAQSSFSASTVWGQI